MARPIANARHFPHRTRRRQARTVPWLRIALVLALLVTLAFGAIRLFDSSAVMVATAVKLDASPAPASVANHVLLPNLESGACMSLAPTHAGSGQTVFIDPGHGGLDPGVVGGTSAHQLSLIHISEPTRLGMISYAVFCLK